MPNRKCSFQEDWLDPTLNSKYSTWLKKGKTIWAAKCSLCSKEFDISHGGISDVKKHHEGKKHQKRIEAIAKTQQLTFFQRTSISGRENRPTESSSVPGGSEPRLNEVDVQQPCVEPSQIEPNQSKQPVRTLPDFLIKDKVTKAEILWAFNAIVCHISSRSAEKSAIMFPKMFGDSTIAAKFQMKKDKLAYSVTYGLCPYFQELLANELSHCDYFVIMFDESLNKVAQKGQMDIVIRYWHKQKSEVATRYLTSVFLGRSTADDLFQALMVTLNEHNLSLGKVLQLSMDGPSVNMKLLKDIKAFQKEGNNPNDPLLMETGTCSLHVVHGAFKTAHNKCDWDIHKFLRCLFFLFKDFPSRRAQFTDITGSQLFPRKFCAIRWVENSVVAERAISMLPSLREYVNKVSNPPKSNNFLQLKKFLGDTSLEVKLGFFQTIALELEGFLVAFQSNQPLIPFLYSDVYKLLHSLLARVLKKTVLEKVTSPKKLLQIDLDNNDNYVRFEKIEIGFPALQGCKGMTNLEVLSFRKECRMFIKILCTKLLDKSPLKYKLVRGASCFEPQIMLSSTLRELRVSDALEEFVEANRISAASADAVKREYMKICLSSTARDKLKRFNRKNIRLDHFLTGILNEESASDALSTFCKMILVLSHGNAAVERSFSVNKELLVENLNEQSLISQRVVYDAILADDGDIEVTKRMIQEFRNASSRRRDALKKQKTTADEAANKRKRAVEEVKELEAKKKKILLEKAEEIESINRQLEIVKKVTKR